jgi:hypothetical protein
MKKINDSEKNGPNQVMVNSDILTKLFAVLLVLVFVLIIIYVIISGLR